MKTCIIAVSVLVFLCFSNTTQATTWYINPDGTGDFPTVQAAIHEAENGDVIELADGTFTGDGNRDLDFLGKAITVRSQSGNPEHCIIDCEYTGRAFYFHSGEWHNSIIESISIINGFSTGFGAGIYVVGDSSPTIDNCIVRDCNAHDDGGGICVRGNSSLCLINSTISGNFSADTGGFLGGGGIALVNCDNALLSNVIVTNNMSEGSAGGVGIYHSYVTINNCTIYDNRTNNLGGGIYIWGSSHMDLSYSLIYNNYSLNSGGGLYSVLGTFNINNCTFVGNESESTNEGGIYGDSEGTGDIYNTIVFGNSGIGVSCSLDYYIMLNCSNVYGNALGDWVDCIQEQLGINGNISEDPQFCNYDYGNYYLSDMSPCAAENNPFCDLIGALPVGCPEELFSNATIHPLNDSGYGSGVAWVDIDNDNDLDIYLANSENQSNKLYLNDGDGNFIDATSEPLDNPSRTQSINFGDYDNDGNIDLYLSNYNDENKLLRGLGAGLYEDVSEDPLNHSGQGKGVYWIDYDLDGDLDIYLVNKDENNVLFINLGNGSFYDLIMEPLSEPGPSVACAWGDYDNDGDPDVYISNFGTENRLIRNDGNGNYVDVTNAPLNDSGIGHGVAWGDYDNDGDLDLYLANYGQVNKLFRNEGNDIFSDATTTELGDPGNGQSAVWADYDNDSDLDIYLTNANGKNKLFINHGEDIFEVVTHGALSDSGDGLGASWGDYDDDGDLDLYISNYGQENLLLRNNQNYGNHWLHIDLYGTLSNRSCIGAKVFVKTGGLTQYRELGCNNGFWSQNSLTVEFGLGAATVVDTLHIIWPIKLDNGQFHSTILTEVEVDQRLLVIEPTGDIVDVAQESDIPTNYKLGQNYPNPFNPQTTISYQLPTAEYVDLRIYDSRGRLVRNLLGQVQQPGQHSVTWNGDDNQGRMVASGTYIYQIEAGSYVENRRMVLVR